MVKTVTSQNGDKSKRRKIKMATPKRRQKWLTEMAIVKTATNSSNTYSYRDVIDRWL